MGKNVALGAEVLEWARSAFADYYRTAPIDPPPRFTRREFAAFPFSTQTLMRRHAAFRTAEEFRAFFPEEVPRHVYYSSAYYRFPSHSTMAAKEWLGADLIFDLDADHLRQAEALEYPAQLRLVKERLKRLLDDFLCGDFGFDPDQMVVAFSGGRGYHVHVREEGILGLGSAERRELVEYILGVGFNPMSALRLEGRRGEAPYAPSSGRGLPAPASHPRAQAASQRVFPHLHPPSAPGWEGRISRSITELMEHWKAIGTDQTAAEMIRLGVSEGTARRIARQLVERGRADAIRTQFSLAVFGEETPTEFLNAILRWSAVEVQGETDAPVTTDIHRLIRLPNSLHGGTGFRVVPLTREGLDAFDPFRDARIPDDGVAPVKVRLTNAVDYPTVPEPARGNEGELLELPRSAALFLILRGEAVPAELALPRASLPS